MKTQGRYSNNSFTHAFIQSRGYLPHVEGAEYQLITYRLNDALPAEVARRLADLPDQLKSEETEKQLDTGYGSCCLALPEIATLIIENWLRFNGERYQILAYVVMPNHAHILIRVHENMLLSKIVHSWKSYTAKQIVMHLNKIGQQHKIPIWQKDYWDRFIRNQAHLDTVITYIHDNPVQAGLVSSSKEWRWSSDFKSQQL